MTTSSDKFASGRVRAIGFGALMLAASAAFGPATATDLWIGSSTCTGLNCNALTVQGTVNTYGGSDQYPGSWVAKVWGSTPGSCLRLDVTNDFGASPDYEMTVVAPSGAVYRNDQGGGACINCPIVKIPSTSAGWYTVVIHPWLTGTSVNENFVLKYGTYNGGNPNCNSATTPFSLGRSAVKSKDAAVSGDMID